MIHALAVSALLSSQVFLPSDPDLLETGLTTWLSEAGFLFPQRQLLDGEPAIVGGGAAPAPWGSFDSVRILGPLESGIWAGPGWAADYHECDVPDSSFRSEVGLMENTMRRNRYSGTLLRPLPGSLRLAATLAREDTSTRQSLRLESGPFDLSARFWQGPFDGGSSWIRYRGRLLAARAGLAEPSAGRHLAEGLVSLRIPLGRVLVQTAAAASGADSLSAAEGHALFRCPAGRFLLTCRADVLAEGSSDPEAGWAAGASATLWGVLVSAGGAALPGERPSAIATAALGEAGLELVLSGRDFGAGIHASGPLGLAGSAAFTRDSLRLAGLLLPEIRFGGNGIVRAGPRASWTARRDSGDSLRVDLLGTLSIKSFSLVLAAEDISRDYSRRYSYGIVWSFDDTQSRQAPAGRGGGQ